MYGPIQISDPNSIANMFDLSKCTKPETIMEYTDRLYMEATFANGKETVKPLVDMIKKIKELLDKKIDEQERSDDVNKFNPEGFWRSSLFKELEDRIGAIFGFRNVEVHPYVEKYNMKEKMFESKILNCEIYHQDRFPIEGLVTDKGFYDKSHSVNMMIHMSLGLIKALEADEVLAVLLHEFGHSIDPALVDIKYTEVNILSKYLTDRKNTITREEYKFMKVAKAKWLEPIVNAISKVKSLLTGNKKGEDKSYTPSPILQSSTTTKTPPVKRRGLSIFGIFGNDAEKYLKKVRNIIRKDKDKFDRQNFSEAFADNFARMYGFGPQLARGLRKLSEDTDRGLRSRYKKEKERQRVILEITEALIKDVHKTDIHRIRNLIKEYKIDIKDPNTSPAVKKQLEDDLKELEEVLDGYMNHFDEFQNQVNKVINEELKNLEG